MKFVPKQIEENVNISTGSEWWHFVNIFLRLVAIACVFYVFLGFCVDYLVPMIPVEYENKLAGPIVSGTLAGHLQAKKYQTEKISDLVKQLAAKSDQLKKRIFQVNVIVNDKPNAKALIGGHIILHDSLLDEIESENELAMILAHELGHFAHRDHLRGLGRSFVFFAVSMVLLGGDANASRLLSQYTGLANRRYSQNQEKAADQFALELINAHYGHVAGALTFFKRMEKREHLAKFLKYFSTHPASKDRIAILQKIISNRKYLTKDTRPIFWKPPVKQKLKAEME